MATTIDLAAFGDGTYSIEDDGIAGNGVSVIRDPAGNIVSTFAHPADSLTILSRAGQSLDIKLTESLGTANLNVGDLATGTGRPDDINVGALTTSGVVTLAATGAIRELGSDAAPDITAAGVALSAGTGVGTGANALELRTLFLEAETNTGGITLGNIGMLVIGGVTDQVNGLDVATSGNINVSSAGSIFLNDTTGVESVHGGATSGNVVLVAKGAEADISSLVDTDAIAAMGGSVILDAGRDVSFGTAGPNYDNDVRARDKLTVKAGRDVNVDGFADLVSDDYGAGSGGNVTVTAGRAINVLNTTGSDGSIGAGGSAGGNLILKAGAGGSVRVLAASTSALYSNSGNVTVNADHLVVDAASGIAAAGGVVTLRPATAGWGVDLGSAFDSGFALELSAAELDRIFTPTLNVGDASTGLVRVMAALAPTSIQNLVLASGTDIAIAADISVAQTLQLLAGDNLVHTAGTLSAAVLMAQVDNAGDDAGTGGFGQFFELAPGAISLLGKADADVLRGAEGVDQLVHGRSGNDTLFSSGEGHYFGDAGNDTIVAGLSSGIVVEVLDGGAGVDTVDTRSFDGTYIVDMATGVTNFGYESFVNFENILTGAGNDQVTGTAAANTIDTGAGDDTLLGGGGDDSPVGGAGADLLEGGAGKDMLRGGGARDVFRFRDGDTAAKRAEADLILDFNQAAGERINLNPMDANTNAAGNQAFTWIGNGAFTGAARELHYVQQGSRTYVEGDTDGDGSADFVIALAGTIDLVAADFAL